MIRFEGSEESYFKGHSTLKWLFFREIDNNTLKEHSTVKIHI